MLSIFFKKFDETIVFGVVLVFLPLIGLNSAFIMGFLP
jgi:hypothetical protein